MRKAAFFALASVSGCRRMAQTTPTVRTHGAHQMRCDRRARTRRRRRRKSGAGAAAGHGEDERTRLRSKCPLRPSPFQAILLLRPMFPRSLATRIRLLPLEGRWQTPMSFNSTGKTPARPANGVPPSSNSGKRSVSSSTHGQATSRQRLEQQCQDLVHSSAEERERIKEFWLGLSMKDRKSLFKSRKRLFSRR